MTFSAPPSPSISPPPRFKKKLCVCVCVCVSACVCWRRGEQRGGGGGGAKRERGGSKEREREFLDFNVSSTVQSKHFVCPFLPSSCLLPKFSGGGEGVCGVGNLQVVISTHSLRSKAILQWGGIGGGGGRGGRLVLSYLNK